MLTIFKKTRFIFQFSRIFKNSLGKNCIFKKYCQIFQEIFFRKSLEILEILQKEIGQNFQKVVCNSKKIGHNFWKEAYNFVSKYTLLFTLELILKEKIQMRRRKRTLQRNKRGLCRIVFLLGDFDIDVLYNLQYRLYRGE